MPPAPPLSLLALHQLLAGAEGETRTAAAEALATRCANGDPALLGAVNRAQKLAWSALEVVVAGDSFWDGCAVFLGPAEHATFRRQVDWLRAHTPLSAGDRADGLRGQCVKELEAHRPGAGSIDGAALAAALRSGAPAGPDEFRHAGCPAVAQAFLYPARDGTPALLPFALARFGGPEPGNSAGIPGAPTELTAALDRIGEILTAHGRGLREWLGAEGSTQRPAAPPGPGATQPQELSAPRRSRLGAWLFTFAVLLLPLLLMVWLIQRYTIDPAQRFEGHTDAVTSVSFLRPGRLVSASRDRTVRFWDTESGMEVGRLEGPTSGRATVVASPDGKQLLVADEAGVRLHDAASGKELKGLKLPPKTSVALAFPDAGPRALTAGVLPRRLQLWDVSTGKRLADLDLEQDSVTALALSADARRAVSGGNNLVIWDLEQDKRLHSLGGDVAGVTAVALSADGSLAASGAWDGTLRVWETASGKEIKKITGPASAVLAVALSADGRMVLSGGSGMRGEKESEGLRAADDRRPLRLWESATGRDLGLFIGPEGPVFAVGFAPDGKSAVSAGADKVIRLWKLPIASP